MAVTADSAISSVDTSRDGFDGVITKPIDPRQLQSTLIGAILRRARQRNASSGSGESDGESGAG